MPTPRPRPGEAGYQTRLTRNDWALMLEALQHLEEELHGSQLGRLRDTQAKVKERLERFSRAGRTT